MLEGSARSVVLDHLGVAYRVDGMDRESVATFRRRASRAELAWVRRPAAAQQRIVRLREVRLPVGLAGDDAIAAVAGTRWRPAEPVLDDNGERVASIWRSGDGGILLPFDLDETVESLWSESYLPGEGSARRASRLYYRLRPLLPRRVQIAARRAYSRIQARTTFPRWPLETALHDLFSFVLEELARVAGEPVPMLAPWPADYRWAQVLTHDVESGVGYEHLGVLRDVEAAADYRSSWNFVPRRDYRVSDAVVAELTGRGFEVGVHGLHHDGRDLESLETLRKRLPAIRESADRWGAVGFRSPATHRRWEWMPLLGFDYDSSYPDTDPFEPQPGGCCSLLPFFNDSLVELPITLPQDHTLFVILRRTDESVWVEKAKAIRERGGMALLNTHPDYMLEPRWVDVYQRFLEAFADDESAWRTLPAEVSAWWRRRAASSIERDGDGWRVVGPAAGEARVVLAGSADQAA